MSDDLFRWVVAGGVILAALSMLVQAIIVIGLGVAVRKTQERVHTIMDKSEPIIDNVKLIVDDLKPKIAAVTTDATDIVKIGKEQVERLSELVKDFSDRAKVQMARIDGAVDETMEQVNTAGGAVRSAILKPVREVNGFFSGLRTAISVYTQGSRASVDHATQDEEMFI